MPSSFAEVWLRIYTKDGMFHGLIQAAYRHILKNLVSAEANAPAEEEHEEEGYDPEVLGGPSVVAVAVEPAPPGVDVGEQGNDPDMLAPIKTWRPGTPEGPATPRLMARNVSTSSIPSFAGGADRRSRTVVRASSFSENQFTKVPPNFRGESPTRKPRSKRGREVSETFEADGQPRKSPRSDESEKGGDAS